VVHTNCALAFFITGDSVGNEPAWTEVEYNAAAGAAFIDPIGADRVFNECSSAAFQVYPAAVTGNVSLKLPRIPVEGCGGCLVPEVWLEVEE
jgi:hypothetical protein